MGNRIQLKGIQDLSGKEGREVARAHGGNRHEEEQRRGESLAIAFVISEEKCLGLSVC